MDEKRIDDKPTEKLVAPRRFRGIRKQVSAFLRAGADSDKIVTLPLDGDGKLTYRYQAAKISASGETPIRTATAQSSPLLVVQTS